MSASRCPWRYFPPCQIIVGQSQVDIVPHPVKLEIKTCSRMMPFGGGGTGRVGRSRMRLDEMDCADIMMKAVQRKRSRSIARRESFSGTEDDLRKFREAVESNDKESAVPASDLQKDIDEYAVKVRELRGDNAAHSQSGTQVSAPSGVNRIDKADTNLEKLPTKEDKCAVKINSNNLGENQSDSSSEAKNINEGVKNSKYSNNDTRDLNADKKNESTSSQQVEHDRKDNNSQPKEPKEILTQAGSNEERGPAENEERSLSQESGINKDNDSCAKEASHPDIVCDTRDQEDFIIQDNIVNSVGVEEPTEKEPTEEICRIQEDQADLAAAPEEDNKNQVNEISGQDEIIVNENNINTKNDGTEEGNENEPKEDNNNQVNEISGQEEIIVNEDNITNAKNDGTEEGTEKDVNEDCSESEQSFNERENEVQVIEDGTHSPVPNTLH